MIENFKRKTIIVLTLIFWMTLIGILVAVNLSNYNSNRLETGDILSVQKKIVLTGGDTNIPTKRNGRLSKIYSVMIDENKKYSVVYELDNSADNELDVIQIAKDIQSQKKAEGFWEDYRYMVVSLENKTLVSFIDYSFWNRQQQQMIRYSLLIGIVGMIMLLVIALRLAKWMTKPVITAFERQKDFIAGAGHELKTPLTVMNASLDILENEYGNNKYFGYIKEENHRMTELVYELLSLSSLDNVAKKQCFQKLDFSQIVEGTCLPFECLAYENGLSLELQIQKEICIMGDELQIRQLIEVLVDNAMKHADGLVVVELRTEKGKAVLRVMNQGEPIPEAERDKIFDRFYRVDKSRNRKAGRFGLGLSIAQLIAESHKSRIGVECEENQTIFSVKFPKI